MKIIVVIVIFLILGALGTALMSLIRGKGDNRRTVNALTLRVALSVCLFLLLLLSYKLGWIHPHGVN